MAKHKLKLYVLLCIQTSKKNSLEESHRFEIGIFQIINNVFSLAIVTRSFSYNEWACWAELMGRTEQIRHVNDMSCKEDFIFSGGGKKSFIKCIKFL